MIRLFVCGCLLCFTTHGFADKSAKKETKVNSGLLQRVPWTTSRVVGSPEPPAPYKVEPAFPKLTFDRPLSIANAAEESPCEDETLPGVFASEFISRETSHVSADNRSLKQA
jgi:hypothetical protein